MLISELHSTYLNESWASWNYSRNNCQQFETKTTCLGCLYTKIKSAETLSVIYTSGTSCDCAYPMLAENALYRMDTNSE